MRALLPAALLAVAVVACGEPQETEVGTDPAYVEAWSRCLRDSELAGVARETALGLDLEIDGVRVVTGTLGQRGADGERSEVAIRFAAVGGELTFGAGVSAEQAWPQAMADQLSRSILTNGREVAALNLGTVFASVGDVLAIATQRAPLWQPHVLVVELDASRRGDLGDDALESALQALRAEAGRFECGVLVAVGVPLAPAARDERHDAAADALLGHADRAGFPTLDLRQVLAGQPPETLVGDVHPHPSAKAQELVFEAIKQALFHSGLLGRAANAR